MIPHANVGAGIYKAEITVEQNGQLKCVLSQIEGFTKAYAAVGFTFTDITFDMAAKNPTLQKEYTLGTLAKYTNTPAANKPTLPSNAYEANQLAKYTNAFAVDKPAVKEAKPKKSFIFPIHGELDALDKAAKTISIREKTLQITSETHITKDAKPATLEDGVEGEEVSATYKKGDDGTLTAVKVHFRSQSSK